MADYFPAEIHIGGPIPKAALRRLSDVAAAEGGSLGSYGGPVADQEAIMDEIQEGRRLSLYKEQATGGQFPQLEAFLVKHGVHFDRHSDAFYTYDAELVCYRGGEQPTTFASNQSGDRLVCCEDIVAILDDDSLDDSAKVRAIRSIVAPPEAAELSPIRPIG